jgi:hypothetical protein
VIAEEGHPVGGDHIENLPAGSCRLRLVHVETDFPIRPLQRQDVVVGGIAGSLAAFLAPVK